MSVLPAVTAPLAVRSTLPPLADITADGSLPSLPTTGTFPFDVPVLRVLAVPKPRFERVAAKSSGFNVIVDILDSYDMPVGTA